MILKYIVELFVKTAQPVGSQYLIEKCNLRCSSATIRNDMMELENMGLLEKTHTSSGRVPSAKGYRYYIDYLRDENLNEDNLLKLKTVLNDKSSQVSDVLRQSCAILSEMTSLTSIMLGPDELEETLAKIQLIPISSNSAVCVFITSNGHVEHKTFNIPGGVNPGDVEKCVEILNERLRGTALYAIAEKMIPLKPVLSLHIEKYELLINAFVSMFNQMNGNGQVNAWGTSNLFDQPEYANNIDKLKKMVKLVESNNVWKFILNSTDKKKINVQIGVNDDDLDDISVVSMDVNVKGQEGAKIALVGPTRMDYAKVIGVMEFLVEQLNLTFGDEEEEN
jgi:heat-inducible transcriptional repressor